MRRLLPLLLFLFLPGRTDAAAAFVQSCSNAQFDGSGISCTLPAPVTAHNHLVFSYTTFNVICNSSGIVDTLGLISAANAPYTQCQALGGNFLSTAIGCAQAKTTSGSDTITVSDGPGRSGVYFIVEEWSGLYENPSASGTTCIPDGTPSGLSSNTGTTLGTGNITTTNANDVLFATAWYYGDANVGLSVAASYVSRVYYNTCTNCANQVAHMFADRTVSATGTYSGTFTASNGGSTNDWLTVQLAIPITAPVGVRHRATVIRYHPRRFRSIIRTGGKYVTAAYRAHFSVWAGWKFL